MTSEECCWWSATDLARMVRRRQVSPVEVVTTHLERIRRLNPELNAYVTVMEAQALDAAGDVQARVLRGERGGSLAGVPVSLKDFVFVAGVRTTGGSRLYADFVPRVDAVIVERLRAAGAVILGKTNTSELGYKPVTDNVLFGPTRNPWDRARTPGGSSGGSAAAVAAGLGPLSIGTDGGGSIRIPAALCGVVGFKPSRGRVPQSPGFPGWDLLGHTGPFARSVEDVRLMMDVIAGPDPRDPVSVLTSAERTEGGPTDVVRVGLALSINGVKSEPEVAEAVQRAASVLEREGCRVEEITIPWADPLASFRVLMATELAAALEDQGATAAGAIEEPLLKFLETARAQSGVAYARALEGQRTFQREVFEWFGGLDVLLTPTTPVPAFPLGPWGPREIAGTAVTSVAWIGFAYPFNLTGQPAISVPCGQTRDGLPIGAQVVGHVGDDRRVLRLASTLETTLAPDGHPHPPLG